MIIFQSKMIVQQQGEDWESLMAELFTWQRKVVAKLGRRVVHLISPSGKTFTTSSSLLSFLLGTRMIGEKRQGWQTFQVIPHLLTA